MLSQIYAQLTVGNEKYRIMETHDSIVTQQLKPSDMDFPEEWVTMYSSVRSKDGLKACMQYFSFVFMTKQAQATELYNK